MIVCIVYAAASTGLRSVARIVRSGRVERRRTRCSGACAEGVEPHGQQLPIRLQRLPLRHLERGCVRLLEQVEHGSVLVLEQPRRDAYLAVGRDPDEILVEGAMMDGAEAERCPSGWRPSAVSLSDEEAGHLSRERREEPECH